MPVIVNLKSIEKKKCRIYFAYDYQQPEHCETEMMKWSDEKERNKKLTDEQSPTQRVSGKK